MPVQPGDYAGRRSRSAPRRIDEIRIGVIATDGRLVTGVLLYNRLLALTLLAKHLGRL
jgi:hypothetical protein